MHNNRRKEDLSKLAEPIYFVIISTCLLAFITSLVFMG